MAKLKRDYAVKLLRSRHIGDQEKNAFCRANRISTVKDRKDNHLANSLCSASPVRKQA